MKSLSQKAGNPFENDNARNSTPEDLPYQFVWTGDFERLISAKNHVLIGARGSGKTAIIKMLSHEYLSRFKHDEALKLISSRNFIGTYVPMRLSWVGGLKSKPWLSPAGREKHFQWRLNVACCSAFLSTIESCLQAYFTDELKRIISERDICTQISQAWFSNDQSRSIQAVRDSLADIEYKKLLDEERLRVNEGREFSQIGIEFDVGLFQPLMRSIAILKRFIEFPRDAVWALCLDEAEYLSAEYQRILNSHMRTFADGLFFKITTMPYKHYTLDTNTAVPLVKGDDFDYIYLDNVQTSRKGEAEYDALKRFCIDLFERRLKGSRWDQEGVTLEDILGSSYVLSDKSIDRTELLELIAKYGNDSTIERATALSTSSKFDDEIGRKLKGALLLREAASKLKGNTSSQIYSGIEMVIRCSDGNPRRFISILNSLYMAGIGNENVKRIPHAVQDRTLRHFSNGEYRRIVSEPGQGDGIYKILSKIGKYFKDCLHYRPLSTDLILSFKYNVDDEDVWSVVSEAVGLGLIKPIVDKSKFDDLPVKSGTFRLSYMLSPHFLLLPRRGKAISLSSILNGDLGGGTSAEQMELI
ncbi:hypothetical protein ACOXVJ_09660 [Pseudomonas knackmussii]|uniref:ORC-CDC6 family AAA ATPase n=1 Tax=Pseudomonas knackmussii TaxID=65741 RepID=UPI003BDF2A05